MLPRREGHLDNEVSADVVDGAGDSTLIIQKKSKFRHG